MAGIKGYSTNPADNTLFLPSGANPGRVDDAYRQLQADIAADYRDREWIEWGAGTGSGSAAEDYSCGYVSPTRFQIAGGDYTQAYHVSRRLRVIGANTGTIYGAISSANYDGIYTQVTAIWDDGSVLQNETGLRVWISTLGGDGRSLPAGAIGGRPIDMDGEELRAPELRAYSEARQTLTISAGVVAWDLSLGTVAYLRLTEDVTSITITGWPKAPAAGSPALYRQQDAVGGRTMTGWPTGVAWFGGVEPPPTADAYAVDIIGLSSIDDGVSVMAAFNGGALFAGYVG